MDQEYAQVAAEAATFIDAIDKNREAINDLMVKIHQDMGNKLVEVTTSDDKPIADLQDREHANRVIQLMVSSYVSGFLTGDTCMMPVITEGMQHLYQLGASHGHAYAHTRKSQSN